MKKINVIISAIAIIVLLSLTALSQAPITNIVSKISQVTPTIILRQTEELRIPLGGF